MVSFPQTFLSIYNFCNPLASLKQVLISFDLCIQFSELIAKSCDKTFNTHMKLQQIIIKNQLKNGKAEFEQLITKTDYPVTFAPCDNPLIAFQLTELHSINQAIEANSSLPITGVILNTLSDFYEISQQQVIDENLVGNTTKIKKAHKSFNSKQKEEFRSHLNFHKNKRLMEKGENNSFDDDS